MELAANPISRRSSAALSMWSMSSCENVTLEGGCMDNLCASNEVLLSS